MIKPSQRQRNIKKPVVSLELHKRIARQRYWATRLLICSCVALGVSVLCWLFAVRPTLHWILLALGFFAGLAIPIKPTRDWALAWIRHQIGLSYETALESHSDSFGFHEDIQERAKEQVRYLEPPKTQAWWLPLLIVSVGFALLPLIPKNLPFSIVSPSTNPSLPNLPDPSVTTSPTVPQQDPSQASSSPSPNTEDTPQSGRSETQELEGELAQSSGDAQRDSQIADQEALSRFLEELEEQHQQQGTSESMNISPELQPPQTSADNAEEGSHPREEQTNPFEQITEPSENTSEAQNNQSKTGNEESEASEQQNQSDQPTENQSPNQESNNPQSQENSVGGNGSETRGENENQALQENGEAEGAGVLGGLPGEQQNQGLESESQQEPELLTGQMTQGPQNVAGTVNLPNTNNETAPISNTVAPSFRPTDEEALTEGKIPLDYQNIVRNYFRY